MSGRLPPSEEDIARLDAYRSALAILVVDVAFMDPVLYPSDGRPICRFCGGGQILGNPTWVRQNIVRFVHKDACVWDRAVILTRPEMEL